MKLHILKELEQTIDASRSKYPSDDPTFRLLGWFQESGEASQALVKWTMSPTPTTKDHAREELLHAMGQAYRALEMLEEA